MSNPENKKSNHQETIEWICQLEGDIEEWQRLGEDFHSPLSVEYAQRELEEAYRYLALIEREMDD